MGSKKQRAKKVKMGPANQTSASQTSTASSSIAEGKTSATTSTKPANDSTTCRCDACMKGFTLAGNDSDSPLLRMPREVRDQIYDELLIAKLPPEQEMKYDQLRSTTGRENVVEYFEQEISIMPGANERCRYRFIADSVGLLLANKQIHSEANAVLFGKNTFIILPEWELVHTSWRCERVSDCHPPGGPRFIMFHNFVQIRHVSMMVHNVRTLDDPMLEIESARLTTNMKNVVAMFKLAGNRLKTFEIRYSSCFEGQIEPLRSAIEGPLDPAMPERPVILKDKHDKYYVIRRAKVQTTLFPHCTTIFDPLRQLKGIAEDVFIRGDLPQAYIDDLTAVLSMDPTYVSATMEKKRAAEATAKMIMKQELDEQSIWREMRDKSLRQNNRGAADLAELMMKAGFMSPAVIKDLTRPPTMEERARSRGQNPASATPAQSNDQGGNDEEVSDVEDDDLEGSAS